METDKNEPEIMEERGTNILIFTSLVFITNIMTALYKEYYVYAGCFLLLTVTSIIVHTYDNIYTNTIDKLAVTLIVVYGSYILWSKYMLPDENVILILLVVFAFTFCIFVYIYGYITQNYCFHSQKCIADVYHSCMHFISSIGHHIIILL